LPAELPLSVIPDAVTAMPVPTPALANAPLAAAQVTVSPFTTPLSEQPVMVATVFPL
jgi:hypothetical protein